MTTIDTKVVKQYMQQEALDEETESAFQEIHSTIAQDSAVLMGLIMTLESHLTSTDDKERNKATLLLAKLLEIQQKPLSSSQIHHFCVFFNSRVADYPSLAPCLRALNGLVQHQWEYFDEKYQDVKDIFETIFKELEVQDLPQSIRSRVFSLLSTLLSCSMVVSVMQPNALRVIHGVLNAIEGEKDPRCLVQSFRLVAHLYAAFPAALFQESSSPVEPHVTDGVTYKDSDELEDNSSGYMGAVALTHGERIFNIMACYFPITFNPPPGDPHGITAPMLIYALMHALCDNDHVASFVVPFLMDQLLAPPETVCRSHAIFYLHYLVHRHANNKMRGIVKGTLPPSLNMVLSQLSESLYDIALEDTTSLPIFSLSMDFDNATSPDTASGQTLTDQAICFIGVVCKQIGNCADQGDLLWSQFGEPIVSEIVKNTRNSVQNMTTKANMKVALAMASSTFKITATLLDRLVPVLLTHVRPVLLADIAQRAALSENSEPATLLQHDLERKQHDKNSAAVGLMYLAQLISCNLEFNLNFSEYSKLTSSDDEVTTDGLFDDLFNLLHDYCMEFFQFGINGTVSVTDRSAVGLYAGCLKCVQALVALRLRTTSTPEDDKEQNILRVACVNCFIESDTSGTSGYDGCADVRQSSVLYVAECRKLYLQNGFENSHPSSTFEFGCIDVFQEELRSKLSTCRLNYIFHTISYLLQPFSASHDSGEQLRSQALSWHTLDDKLLSILLECVTSSAHSSDSSNIQEFALDALLNCLPASPPLSNSSADQNYIVSSLVTKAADGSVTNLQKLIEFAVGPSCDNKSLSLVSRIVHRVLASLYMSQSTNDDFKGVVEGAIHFCIQAMLLGCVEPPTATIFTHDFDTSSIASSKELSFGSSNQAAAVLLSILNVLGKDSWVWKLIESIGAEGADNKSAGLWAQLLNVVFSNLVLRDSDSGDDGDARVFSIACSRILAVILNKCVAGPNLDTLLVAVDNLVCAFLANSASMSLSTQESTVQVLILIVRSLIMRRNLIKTNQSPDENMSAKTWQDRFMNILMNLVTDSSGSNSLSQCDTLALVAKHMSHLSCDHKDGFLNASTSNSTSMMWRQKLWHKSYPVLSTAVQQASALCLNDNDSVSQPISALLTLCGLASEMPYAVVQEHFPSIISFSVQALMVNDPNSTYQENSGSSSLDEENKRSILMSHTRTHLRDAAVQCLLSACRTSSPVIMEALSPHLSILVPLLLQGAQANSSSTLAATRAGCVQCLFYLAGGDMCQRFPYHVLHPMKRLVVRGLAIVLNDKKQAVRRWAAKVRNLWIALQE